MTKLTQQLKQQLASKVVKVYGKAKEEDVTVKIYESSSNVQYTLEEFFNQYNPEEIPKGQCNLTFRIDVGGQILASFQLKDMYNCCGIIVGSDLHIYKPLRNNGVGTILTKFMMDFSSYYGYGVIQGADRKDNEYQTKIFTKLGWNSTNEFKNPKTNNVLKIWLFNLTENVNVPTNENQ